MAREAIRYLLHKADNTTLESGRVSTRALGPKRGGCQVVLHGSSSRCQIVGSKALGTHVTRWIDFARGPVVGPANGLLVKVV